MFHKVKNGDIYKILPIIKKDGSTQPFIDTTCVYLDNKIIYDDPSKNYLNRLYLKDRSNPNTMSRRHIFCIYINNEIKFISVTRTLFKLISENYDFDIRNNSHICIIIEMKNSNIGPLPSYDLSTVFERDWIKPVKNTNSSSEWINWIKINQPLYIEDFLVKNGIYYNIDIINKHYDGELDEIIKEDRDLKLNTLLNLNHDVA